MFDFQPVQPGHLIGTLQLRLGAPDQIEEEDKVAVPKAVHLTRPQ